MCTDAAGTHAPDDEPARAIARDGLRASLVRTLNEMQSSHHRPTYDAVCLLVDAMVMDGFTPEAAVIAVKGAIEESACLLRFEKPMREPLRAALVEICINRYFESRELFATRTPSPAPIIPPRGGDADARSPSASP